jgi:S1-C subfamily serine protease
MKGEVVGIASAIIAPDAGNVVIGFTIPASAVHRVLPKQH